MDLKMNRFRDLKFVGAGAFGRVYRGQEHSSGLIRALKVLHMDKSAMSEVNTLSRIENHPNIVEYINYFFTEEEKLCLVMKYCSGGTLNDYLVSHRQPEPSRDLRFMREIASAVAFLHRNRIVHRDLKPDNVLLTAEGTLKVADFGLAKLASESQHGGSLYDYYIHSGCGTILFCAPEVFNERSTEKADVFQMGVIFACIMERKILSINDKYISVVYVQDRSGNIKGVGQALHEGMLPNGYKLSEGLTSVSRDLRRVVEVMLDGSFHSRPSAEDVCKSLVTSQTRETQVAPSTQVPSTTDVSTSSRNTDIGLDFNEALRRGVMVFTGVVCAAIVGELFDAFTEDDKRRRRRDSDKN